jgi:hypothetical protein
VAPDAPASSAASRVPRLALPLALFAGALLALLLNLPARTYGDDCFFVWCIVRHQVFAVHFLYMPLARAWAHGWALLGVDPLLALRLLSASGAAAGTALLAAAARRRGLGPGAAAALALLVLTANSAWFFAGAAEVHGTHLAAVGLLAWTLAGFGPASSPRRALAAALVFGVAVGAHKTSALLLPGVLCAYALATPGRARAARARDAAAFALGGALALGAQLAVQALATGAPAIGQDTPGYWLAHLPEHLANLAPRALVEFLGRDFAAPAFALAWLGAVAAGSLLRARPRHALALAATVLPHLVFFPLFGYIERGAYYIPILPVLTWAAARAGALGGERGPAQRAFTALALLAAAAGALLTPPEILAALRPAGLCALLAAGALGGFLFPRHACLGRARAAQVALALAACQLIGSQRDLRAWDSERPLLDWGRDAVAATGPGTALITAGFDRFYLMRLLDRPWPAPFTDSWGYARSLPTPGPATFEGGDLTPEGVNVLLDRGSRVFVLEEALEQLASRPELAPRVRALREQFKLTPVAHGRFAALEVTR